MGVYIKGMEMPVTCQKCEFAVPGVDSAYCERHEKTAMDFSVAENGRPDWCPLVEVPPHGRLIDEEAVIDHFVNLSNNEWNQNASTSWANAFAEAASDISDIPTIIEAEKGDRRWKHLNI